ncbi:MAG: thiamine phosphate synthase [Bacteroidales bacterium]|nr:thiamine phosphate synthase [Bacteroidales bacterium]
MRRLIGITPEKEVFSEHRRISNLILAGEVEYFHIRKPSFSEKEMRDYLSCFDNPIVKERLSLHDYHNLAFEFGIGGIHINKRNPLLKPEYDQKRISVSCHSIEEFEKWSSVADYCFLSPIFDSISKENYTSKFALSDLKTLFENKILNNKVVALGGVNFENIKELTNIGFTSFAMLGRLWQLPKTMFITPNKDSDALIQDCEKVLEGGIKFIQLRMKETKDEEVVNVAKYLRTLCNKHCALLTVDDRIELLHTNLFDGVHLGKNDMPIKQAKKITKSRYLLGATCNTLDDVKKATNDGADYLGVGPFRYTTTKKNLAHILGLDGYLSIIKGMEETIPKLPIYAIGGITVEDLKELKQTGVYGVAISGSICNAQNPKKEIKEILNVF